MIFTGTYKHAVDVKSRLAIPSKIRSQIQRSEGQQAGQALTLVMTLGEDGCLCLYTESGFEQRAKELDASTLDHDELLAYERLFFSSAETAEIDKQGRVRLPESLLSRTELGSDVVLLGVKDHLEVHDRQTWLVHVEQQLKNNPSITMNPRRAMRKSES